MSFVVPRSTARTTKLMSAIHHFGVLVPSTNTTVEIEHGRLLPVTLQVHVARRLLRAAATPMSIIRRG
jgi:maleate cis-trans isomerase